tara:strand:+ start:533 stop:988 length:456 start_codon:yes stop_codon:yes gene_type:complete
MKTIEILSLNDETQYFSININNNINIIKNKIKNNLGININEQLWLINGNTPDENIKIKQNDEVCIIIDNKWIKIKIKLLNNKILELPLINSNINIYDLKLIIFSLNKSLIPSKINILFNNNLLNDNKKLSDYNIINNSTIHLTFKIKSGFV